MRTTNQRNFDHRFAVYKRQQHSIGQYDAPTQRQRSQRIVDKQVRVVDDGSIDDDTLQQSINRSIKKNKKQNVQKTLINFENETKNFNLD